MSVIATPPHLRFWDKVEQSDDCWRWLGAKCSYGYGVISIGPKINNRLVKAHRISYEIHYGSIPDGFSVCHSCDNPECTNPSHLFAAPHRENMLDMVAKRRHAFGSRNGHAKLCELDVWVILSLPKIKGKVLAKFFGISDSVISQIRSRQIWTHVHV